MDIVFGTPEEEIQGPRTTESFVEEKVRIMQEAYRLVREHLGVSLRRAKRYYDIKARFTKFKIGEWVWMYSPRRYVQRSPKWQRMYGGPFLVVRQINEVNYVLQKSRRSQAFVVHVDKLKSCKDQSRENWLNPDMTVDMEPSAADPVGPADVPATPVVRRKRNRPQPRPIIHDNSDSDEEVVRPKRRACRPRRFDDFEC